MGSEMCIRDRIKAMHLGAYGFLCKPFTDMELAEAVEELIEDLV